LFNRCRAAPETLFVAVDELVAGLVAVDEATDADDAGCEPEVVGPVDWDVVAPVLAESAPCAALTAFDREAA
jgi:hypothetical protein